MRRNTPPSLLIVSPTLPLQSVDAYVRTLGQPNEKKLTIFYEYGALSHQYNKLFKNLLIIHKHVSLSLKRRQLRGWTFIPCILRSFWKVRRGILIIWNQSHGKARFNVINKCKHVIIAEFLMKMIINYLHHISVKITVTFV